MILIKDKWLLTPERVAVHMPTRTAVTADLHLGYHEARLAGGDAIPASSLESQLRPLHQAQRRTGFTQLVVAGDLFERRYCPDLTNGFARFLAEIGVTWRAFVPGNHDRGIQETLLPCAVHHEGFAIDDWRVIHGDGKTPSGKVVMGHWHPCWVARRQRWPCYLMSRRHLVLPAFSANAAGIHVPSEKRWRGFACYVIRKGQVERIADTSLYAKIEECTLP